MNHIPPLERDIALAKWAREVAMPAMLKVKKKKFTTKLCVLSRFYFAVDVISEALESMPKPEKENAEHEDY